MSDGVIEMMLVKKMSRLKFINLIGKYKNGTLVKDEVLKKYGDYVTYLRVKNMKISGCKQICSDGEIENCTSADISIIPGAIQYRL
jgi:diacylglycerol kinase family enzyme